MPQPSGNPQQARARAKRHLQVPSRSNGNLSGKMLYGPSWHAMGADCDTARMLAADLHAWKDDCSPNGPPTKGMDGMVDQCPMHRSELAFVNQAGAASFVI
jgi:hypothetical protein